MKSSTRTVGLMQAKNEWPVVGLSISYALMHHVDEVYVMNHSSTDFSAQGLQELQKIWQNRLHILNSYDERYWQEATSNALISIAQQSAPDWIYVLDADEFMLTHENKPLKRILDSLDPDCSIIRYQVQNWIPTRDFDETCLNDYRKLRYRSMPNQSYSTNVLTETQQGIVNFYDIPFHSKVIFRNKPEFWLGSGSHMLRSTTVEPPEHHMAEDQIRCAHFPFLSRKRLELKIQQAERLTQDKFPTTYGWQSHMIHGLAKDNKLEWFWNYHSIGKGDASDKIKEPIHVIDDAFIAAIEPTCAFLSEKLGTEFLQKTAQCTISNQKSDDVQLSLPTLIELTQKVKELMDALNESNAYRHAIYLEHNAMLSSSLYKAVRGFHRLRAFFG